LNMEVKTPIKSMSVTGRHRRSSEENSRESFMFSGNVGEKSVSAEVGVDGFIPHVDMKVQYSPDKIITMRSEFEKPSSLVLETCQSLTDENCVRDGELSLRLLEDDIFQARAYIRPAIFDDIKNFISMGIDVNSLRDSYSEYYEDIVREKDARLELISDTILAPLLDAIADTKVYLLKAGSRLYKNNDYYFKDMADFLIISYNKVESKLDEITVIYSELFARKWVEIQDIVLDLQTKYGNSTNYFFDYINEAESELRQSYKYNMDKVRKIGFRLKKSLAVYVNEIEAWFEEIKTQPSYIQLESWANEQTVLMQQNYQEMNNFALESWENLKTSQDLKLFYNTILDMLDQLDVVYELLDVEKQAKRLINDLREKGISELYTKTVKYIEEQKKRWSFQIVDVTFENGLAEIKIGVPKELTTLESLYELQIVQVLEDYYIEMIAHLHPYMDEFFEICDSVTQYLNEAYRVVLSRVPDLLTGLQEGANSAYERVIVPYIQPFVYNLWDVIESFITNMYSILKDYYVN